MGKAKLHKTLFYSGAACAVYFWLLVILSFYPPTNQTLIGAIRFFGELLTLPFAGFLLFLTVFSFIKITKRKNLYNYLAAFLICIITVLFLAFVTLFQMN